MIADQYAESCCISVYHSHVEVVVWWDGIQVSQASALAQWNQTDDSPDENENSTDCWSHASAVRWTSTTLSWVRVSPVVRIL